MRMRKAMSLIKRIVVPEERRSETKVEREARKEAAGGEKKE